MKKIILSALISTTLVGSSYAVNGISPAFGGFYAGGGLTYSKGNVKNLGNDTRVKWKNSSAQGLGFDVFAGYGAILGQGFYLGAEMNLGYDGSRFKNSNFAPLNRPNSVLKLNSKSRLNYGISGRIGYAICNFLPYVKFGYEYRSKINILENGKVIQTFTGKAYTMDRKGFVLGIGGDYALNKNVFLRAEYTHNFGSKNTITRKFRGRDVKLASFKTSTDTFLIGAAYKF